MKLKKLKKLHDAWEQGFDAGYSVGYDECETGEYEGERPTNPWPVSESEPESIPSAFVWEDGPLVKAMNEAAARGETLLVDEVEDYRGAQDRFRQFYITKARDLLMVPDEGPQVRFRVTRDDDFKARAEGIPVGEYCWSLTCDEAPFECWDARSCGEATDLIPAFWAYLSEGTFILTDQAGHFDWLAPEVSGFALAEREHVEDIPTPDTAAVFNRLLNQDHPARPDYGDPEDSHCARCGFLITLDTTESYRDSARVWRHNHG